MRTRPKAKSKGQGRNTPHVSQTGAKPWSGRFRDRTHRLVETFTSSLSFDRRLYPYDLQGSMVHCRTLERAGVLSRKETAQILRGLEEVRSELESGRFSFARG